MLMPGRKFSSDKYRYGFNGKENDNEVKGDGNQQDYGMRVYDGRIGKFLSVDPLFSNYPYYSTYQSTGNNPIRFIDLDGEEPFDNSSKFWADQPLINMNNAPAKGFNAAGVPRNAIWFFKQQLAAKPEMFSAENKMNLNRSVNPVVDETWIKFNPESAGYKGQTLVHHHINGGEMAAAIPQRMHYDNFKELHPYLKGSKSFGGKAVKGLLGGTINFIGNVSLFSGLFSGDPDAWINGFGFGEPNEGDIKRDWGNTELYVEIISIKINYTPLLDKNGKVVIDNTTGKPKQRVQSKIVTANIYSDYIWDDDNKKYRGLNKVGSKTEQWNYNEKGNRIEQKDIEMV